MVGYCGSIGMAHLPHKGGTSSWRAVTYIYIYRKLARVQGRNSKRYAWEHATRDHSTTWLTCRVFAPLIVPQSRKRVIVQKLIIIRVFFFFRFLLLLYRLIASKSCFNVHIYIVRFYSNFVRIIFFFGNRFSKFNGWQFDLLFI